MNSPKPAGNAPKFIHRFIKGSEGVTLLLLHGTGGNEDDMLPLASAIRPTANFLSLRGRVLEDGMPRFFRRLAEGVFDLPDLIQRTHELADFLLGTMQELQIDPMRLVAVGYSNGANIAASTLLLRPGILSAAILLRPMVPLEPEAMPSLNKLPIYIAAGRLDPLIPTAESERLAALFRSAGSDVTLSWQEGGHGLTSRDVQGAGAWLAALYPPPR